MDTIKEKLAEQAEGVMEGVYNDLVSPSIKPIGTMLSYLPRTIRLFFSKWEKWIINGEESLNLTGEILKEKLKNIPEEKICEPEPYVAIPAIQQIAYCYDSTELREAYANLLAASMNEDKKWEVHPSFVNIIKQLSPDEARLLKAFPRRSTTYVPVIHVTIDKGRQIGKETIKRNVVEPRFYNLCNVPDNMSSYLENLVRLKLITIPEDLYIADEKFYMPIENSELIKNLQKEPLENDQKYSLDRKLLYVTDFGITFANCCIYPE